MKTRIRQWGNSLGLRIPRSLAEDVMIREDSLVDLVVDNGVLRISAVRDDVPSLDELVAGITPENRHEEEDWGPAVGREIW